MGQVNSLNTFVPGTDADANAVNSNFTQIITAYNATDQKALYNDGTKPMTANLPMGNFRVTGMADPVNIQDAVTLNYFNNHDLPQGYITGLVPSVNITLLTGTVTLTNNSSTLTGSGTSFTTQAPAGTILIINGTSYTVSSVTNNTSLTLTITYTGTTTSGLIFYSLVNTITISVGQCSDSTNTVKMALTSSMVKNLASNWSVGSGNGGLGTGTKAGNTTYYIFVISNTAGNVDAGFDTSSTATNLLATSGYTYYKRIGNILTDSNANIISFYAQEMEGSGINYDWISPPLDYYFNSSSGLPTTLTNLTLTVPANMRAKLHIWTLITATGLNYFKDLNTGILHPWIAWNSAVTSGDFEINVNGSSQIQQKYCAGGNTSYIYTRGYIDYRRN